MFKSLSKIFSAKPPPISGVINQVQHRRPASVEDELTQLRELIVRLDVQRSDARSRVRWLLFEYPRLQTSLPENTPAAQTPLTPQRERARDLALSRVSARVKAELKKH